MKQKNHDKNQFRSKLNSDKVIGFYLSCTPIRKYRGVLENYIRWSLSTLHSEGKQAQDRLKSYKEYFENQLASMHVQYPRPGKYKKLLPILKVLDELLEDHDLQGVRMLATVMRIHEMARPSQKYLRECLRKFIFDMDPKAQPVDENSLISINLLEESEDYISIVNREQNQYPDFPWQEFRDWLALRQDEARDLVLKNRPRIQLSASLLVKSSSSRVRTHDKRRNKFHSKSYPAIALADIEQAFLDLESTIKFGDTDHTLQRAFARALLKSLNLDKSITYNSNLDEVINDRKALANYITNDILLYRMYTMAIEGSNGIKDRIVTKVSYPMQYPLQPFHESAIAVAQRIPGDYSGNHDEGFRSLNRYAKDANYLADVDATAWTDYFPLAFQYEVVKTFYGEEVAGLWVRLMRVSIYTDLGTPEEPEIWRYRMHIGQPMGAYGSWAIANLSHHCLVRFAYDRAGSPFYDSKGNKDDTGRLTSTPKYPYWIIGDDEVSADFAAQTVYLALESSLGIKINSTKSKVLSTSNHKYLAELAHRQTLRGEEVTGISPKLVVNSFMNYARLVELLRFTRSRELMLDEDRLIGNLLKELDSLKLQGFRKEYGKSSKLYKNQIKLGLRIPTCVGGLLPDDSNWNTHVDPLLFIAAMLCKISSILSYYRPGSPMLRDGRDNSDKVLNAMRILPEFVNVDNSALARYERRVYNDSLHQLFLREVGQALSTLMDEYAPRFIGLTIADYSCIDMEDIKIWSTKVLANLESIAGIPVYLAREYRQRSDRDTIDRLIKLDPDNKKFSDQQSWSLAIADKYLDLKNRLDNFTRSIFKKKNKSERRKDIDRFYQDLFSSDNQNEGG